MPTASRSTARPRRVSSDAPAPGADARPHGPILRKLPVQARGRQRVETLLDAAAEVIADVGVEAATMNEIARRAGAAKGSLYQFFPDKDAIVAALAVRYAAQVEALHAACFADDPRRVPLERIVSGVIDPLADFLEANPAYRHLRNLAPSCRGLSGDVRSPIAWETLDRSIVARVTGLLAVLAPSLSAADAERHATILVTTGQALLALRDDSPAARRPMILEDLKQLLLAYLVRLVAAA
jgi:AcrR family transcriptional regulator